MNSELQIYRNYFSIFVIKMVILLIYQVNLKLVVFLRFDKFTIVDINVRVINIKSSDPVNLL